MPDTPIRTIPVSDSSFLSFSMTRLSSFLLVLALILPPIIWWIKRKKAWPVDETRLAPIWERGVARFIDLIICSACIYGMEAVFLSGAEENAVFFENVAYLVGVWLYFAGFESSSFRATPGKMMENLIVCRTDGKKMSFALASVRLVGTILADIPFFLGHATWFFTPYRQTFQDLVTDTVVLKKQ